MNSLGAFPFILVGPRDGEKTDFLLACALAHAAEIESGAGDRRNALILCAHQMVADQIRLCFDKAMPDTGGIGVNCLTYHQLMHEAGYQGPPRAGVPPSYLRDVENGARLSALIGDRFGLVLFDQMFEAIRYFPELMRLIPPATKWAGALTSPTNPSQDFEGALTGLKAGFPNLAIRRTKAASRKYASRTFLSYSDLEGIALDLEGWIVAAAPEMVEATARAWPRVIVLHRSLWTKRKRIAAELADYLRARGCSLFNGLNHEESLPDQYPDLAIVTEFEARGLASKYELVLHNRPEDLVVEEFVTGEQELEGGGYSADQWDIRRLAPYELAAWAVEEAAQKILLLKGKRVFLLNLYCNGPQISWHVEVKCGATISKVSPGDLFIAEPRKGEE